MMESHLFFKNVTNVKSKILVICRDCDLHIQPVSYMSQTFKQLHDSIMVAIITLPRSFNHTKLTRYIIFFLKFIISSLRKTIRSFYESGGCFLMFKKSWALLSTNSDVLLVE